jgi:hypothetical protein
VSVVSESGLLGIFFILYDEDPARNFVERHKIIKVWKGVGLWENIL